MQECAEFSQLGFDRLAMKKNKVGLLGGTFNPIHNGHLAMAGIALGEFELGEVIFLPLGDPPHKQGKTIAPAQQRLDMIALAIEGHPAFSVDTMELYRTGYTYTVDTLTALLKRNINTQYHYIIGADTLFELHTWKNFERVITMTDFICVLRPGIDDLEARAYAQALNDKYGKKVYVADAKGPQISSSEIRALAGGGLLGDSFVPDAVAQYIRHHHLYDHEE